SFKEPQDWSKYSAVSFWLHSQRATNSAFMLIVRSENERTKGMDYYPFRIVLNWTGWRHFILPFRELGRAREPIGWHKIDSVTFTASGWGNEPHPDAVVRLDGFELTHVKMEGPRMSDEEFFNALNLKMPQLKAVKEAVERGDYMVAKRALARHIRERTYPRWFFDWRDHPFRGVKVPPPEADRAPDQWDYFSRYITIDWEGWRHFSLKKDDFSPRAFVEGKGWRGKKPIGWHWIRYMQFSARGWGLKPHPNAVLYFDDIRLVGKNKSVVICDFESERHPFEGLERTDERAKQGRFSGKWASQLVTGSIRCWKIPHDWSEFDALEFWVYSEKATGSRIILVLDSDAPKARSAAEDYVQKKFTWN
ncbi:MAG TPA: hypothetical protein EYP10_11140, partial [Armatimonadetes bacterium]|nr:hypothetical protein [Armatimonadota bacterium]